MGAHLIIPGGTRVIDATGKYVFPGGIDANVHFETPYVKVNTYRTTWHGALPWDVHMGSEFMGKTFQAAQLIQDRFLP